MIDFHTHILYDIDDGAENIAQSLKLINSLKSQGVNKIVLTPHFYFKNVSEDGFFIHRKKIADELKLATADLNIKLYTACEVYISKSNLTNNLHKFAISGTKYIMIELPHRTALSDNIYDLLTNIIDYAGLIPIIAHAERYPAVLSEPEIISELIDLGCLIQMNTSSLFNKSFQRLSRKMLELGQVHCIGTDCHNDSRPPIYTKAKQEIEKEFGQDCFKLLQKNMHDILDNKVIKVKSAKPIKKIFSFYV